MALPAGTREVTSQQKLRKLLSTYRSAQGDIDEITESLRTETSNAVEKHHLHRRAFNMIKALDKLSPEKLAEWSEHFEHYMEISGLNERIASAPSLALGNGADESELDADEAEQQKALKRRNGKGAAAAAAAEEETPAGEKAEGNLRNFPTPQGRA
jgi:hypothetical protein